MVRTGKNLGARLLNFLPIHVRSTIAFDGTSGNGAVGTVDVFTITGRVFLERLIVFCTEDLVGAATIEVGTASRTAEIIDQGGDATAIDVNEWWSGPSAQTETLGLDVLDAEETGTRAGLRTLSADIIITIGNTNITDGTLVFDAWYTPITDDGVLV